MGMRAFAGVISVVMLKIEVGDWGEGWMGGENGKMEGGG